MSLGPVLLGSQEAIDHDNEVELPKRRAAHQAYYRRAIELRKRKNALEQAAAGHWVAGFGHTNPQAWREAAKAAHDYFVFETKARADHSFTDARPGSLEYSQAKANQGPLKDDSIQLLEWAKKAEENEAKIAAKKAADEAASAKAAKNKAAAEKRKATLAAKKTAKDWAKP